MVWPPPVGIWCASVCSTIHEVGGHTIKFPF